MINIYLFKFNKKINSTKLPTGIQGIHLTGALKEPCSLLHPVLELHTTTDLSQYNYCQVTELNRYYWIDDVIFNRGFYNLQCSVDVLASYKTAIGNTEAYCLRSYAKYDGTLSDEAWPVSTSYDYVISTAPSQYSWLGFDHGYYVVGIKGTSNLAVNGVIYYMFTPAQFTTFITQFYANTGNNTYFGNLARGIVDSIYNISDFIVSCRWYPIQLNATTAKPVYVGSYQVPDGSGGYLQAPICVEHPATVLPYGFKVPKHPEASWRGAYMNSAPFTKYEIVTPWGMNIPLGSYFMRDRANITMHLVIDFTSGQAAVRIKDGATPYEESAAINYDKFTTYINFGVNIPLGGVDVNVGGVIGNIAGAVVNAFTGNPLAAAGNVGNALMSAIPEPGPSGSTGGYVPIEGTQPYLASYFYHVAPTSYVDHGRPYCVNETPANIGSGYMIYENFSVEIAGTNEEANLINSHMRNGIYYE